MKNIKQRRYSLFTDFQKVYDFLEEIYTPYNSVEPQYWEYAHYHSMFNHELTHRMGIWEDNGKIVGAAFYEMNVGEAYFAIKKEYKFLKQEMLNYAEKELSKVENDRHILEVISFDDPEEDKFYSNNGYNCIETEPIMIYPYNKGFAERKLPDGFSIISLEDELDLVQINACMWKGFDHGDNPPAEHIDGRLHSIITPRFRRDLTTVIKAPNGDYACLAGMWYDEKNKYAYLEPLATVPEYRRMGLATIAFMEAMKKTQILGATYCYSGTRDFYHSIGCEIVGYSKTWRKEW